MIIQGTITKRLPLTSGTSKAGKTWYSQSWLIETALFGEIKVDFLRYNEDDIPSQKAGDIVEFDLKIKVNEYVDKKLKTSYFTSIYTNEFTLVRDIVEYDKPVSIDEQEDLPKPLGDLPF